MTLTFNAADHIYRVDGRIVDSVSQIAQGFAFKGEPLFIDTRWYKASGTNRGSSVHEKIEAINRGGLAPSDFAGDDHEGYINAFGRFRSDTGFVTRFAEVLVYHPALDYCGTVDMVGERDGVWAVADLKTGSPERWHALQLNAYRLALRDNRNLYQLSDRIDEHGAQIADPIENPLYGLNPAMRVLYLRKTGTYKYESEFKGESFDSPTFENTWIGATHLRNWRMAA